jgi:hypothetical protein
MLKDIKMNNPIKNNRIVNDETFAIRLRDFIKRTDVCDQMSEEEKEYLLRVSEDLLHYQIETATDESELKYLENIKDLI